MTSMSDPPRGAAPTTFACPNCGEAIRPDDAFCESCGHTLRDDAVQAAADAPQQPPADGATVVVAARDAPTTAPKVPCALCGSDVLDDGFCSNCGAKALSRRDHWTERPRADVAGVCDKGIAHARNEDAMALAVGGGSDQFSDERMVIVVCDGVTSAPDSDRASLAACIDGTNALLSAPVAPPGEAAAVGHWTEQLRVCAVAANAAAVGVAHTLGDPPEPPSCTFVGAVAVPAPDRSSTLVAVAWCGDSRAYWFGDDGDARQLSVDHSLGTEMIASGMTVAEAEAQPTSHTITRWLGADSVNPVPEIMTMTPTGPGWLLVCSDGMWNYASSPPALGLVMLRAAADLGPRATPLSIAEAMAGWANAQGGHDNITVVLGRIHDPAFTASTTD
jgi:serine/threonine protein phosphatase PrpC